MPETMTPAPGEIRLGTPKNQPAAMPDSILEAALAAGGAAPSKPSPEPAEPPKPAVEPAVAQKEGATPAKATAASPAAKVEPEPAPTKPKGIEAVREALERETAKAKKLEESYTATSKEKADAYTKVADLETKFAKLTDEVEKDLRPRAQRLEAVEKELQQRENLLRVKDYTATREFHDKYIKPIIETQTEVADLLLELRATINGEEVQATNEHFNYVMGARSLNEAAARAREIFGPDVAPQVVNLRSRLISADRKRGEAVKNAELESLEWHKNTQAQQAQQAQERNQQLMDATMAEINKFKPADDDTESIAAIQEGIKLISLAQNGSPDMTQEQHIATVGKARAWVAKLPLVEMKLAKAYAKIEALSEELKAYQKSEPEVRTRASGGKPAGEEGETWQDKITAAAVKLGSGY